MCPCGAFQRRSKGVLEISQKFSGMTLHGLMAGLFPPLVLMEKCQHSNPPT